MPDLCNLEGGSYCRITWYVLAWLICNFITCNVYSRIHLNQGVVTVAIIKNEGHNVMPDHCICRYFFIQHQKTCRNKIGSIFIKIGESDHKLNIRCQLLVQCVLPASSQ